MSEQKGYSQISKEVVSRLVYETLKTTKAWFWGYGGKYEVAAEVIHDMCLIYEDTLEDEDLECHRGAVKLESIIAEVQQVMSEAGMTITE